MLAHPGDILSLPTESFVEALARLDPASRALLDLSLRRGMRPEEIAELLGTDPESVVVAREQALDQLAADLGVRHGERNDELRARLAELPGEAWGTKKAEEPAPEPSRGSRLPVLLAVLGVVGLVLVSVLVAGGDEDEPDKPAAAPAEPDQRQPAQEQREPEPEPEPQAKPAVKLTAISGRATGAARVTGRRLELRVRGLRRGLHQVWLYDSLVESRPVGRSRKRSFTLRARLPADWRRYRFLDVSRERANGNRNHSGVSVLRVRTARLGRGA